MGQMGFFILAELVQERGRAAEPEEILDRIRAIQKLEGDAEFEKVLGAYNGARIGRGAAQREQGRGSVRGAVDEWLQAI